MGVKEKQILKKIERRLANVEAENQFLKREMESAKKKKPESKSKK